MCGIAGFAGLNDTEAAERALGLMNAAISHRGPDAEGVFIRPGIALGHRRLSIIDLSESANQPMFDAAERFSIVYNGEIYNYRDVRAELADYPFRTASDTETILAAYQLRGPDCLALLEGMFAFAVWDAERRELFVARDRLGVKPLYYAHRPDGLFVFASELRAVLDSRLVERKLNDYGVYDYLMHQSVYAPETISKGVYQLPAGHYGIYREGVFSTRCYWNIAGGDPTPPDGDERAVRRKVRELLLGSVESRLIADVRLGAFLSGGIDSSAIVALMAEVSASPVETFSVTFAEKEYDESPYSDLIARKFNTRHTRVRLGADDFLEALPAALAAADTPSGDGVNTYVVSKAARAAGIKVCLSGLGGDELFAGYPNFLNWARLKNGFVGRVPAVLRKPLAFAVAASKDSRRQRMADILRADNLNISEVYPMFRQVLSEQTVGDLYEYPADRLSIRETLRAFGPQLERFPLLSQYTVAELAGYTQNVLLKDTDQFSMASALEVREPFFDYRLVEYVLRIPDRFKHPVYPKSLLVEALAPLLPEEIVHRPKMGFVLPFDHWMRHQLKDFCERRIERLEAREILRPGAARRRWRDFQAGANGVLWSHVWPLVVLTEWLETNRF